MPRGIYPRNPETWRKISAAHKGKKLSEDHRKKIGEAHKGLRWSEEAKRRFSKKLKERFNGNPIPWLYQEKHWKWKGGITSFNQKDRNSAEYKEWRTKVFRRDAFACVECGAKNGHGKTIVLNADHIKPFSSYPKLRFAIENGRTLCISCHKKTDTYKLIN